MKSSKRCCRTQRRPVKADTICDRCKAWFPYDLQRSATIGICLCRSYRSLRGADAFFGSCFTRRENRVQQEPKNTSAPRRLASLIADDLKHRSQMFPFKSEAIAYKRTTNPLRSEEKKVRSRISSKMVAINRRRLLGCQFALLVGHMMLLPRKNKTKRKHKCWIRGIFLRRE